MPFRRRNGRRSLLDRAGEIHAAGAGLPDADQGWAGRHSSIHEVAAVTGACLAVERRKFEAVGGFDSEYLPIELNDVDLCLRLNEKGC